MALWNSPTAYEVTVSQDSTNFIRVTQTATNPKYNGSIQALAERGCGWRHNHRLKCLCALDSECQVLYKVFYQTKGKIDSMSLLEKLQARALSISLSSLSRRMRNMAATPSDKERAEIGDASINAGFAMRPFHYYVLDELMARGVCSSYSVAIQALVEEVGAEMGLTREAFLADEEKVAQYATRLQRRMDPRQSARKKMANAG